jgi:hypothetical protein
MVPTVPVPVPQHWCRQDRRGCDRHGEEHSPQVIWDHIITPLLQHGADGDRQGCDHRGEVHSPQVNRDHIIFPLVQRGVDRIDEAVTAMEKNTLLW